MARPRKDDRKDARLAVRLHQAELDRISRAARVAGFTLSDYFRHALLNEPPPPSRRRRYAVQDAPELARLLGAVGMIGSNVNQLARTANGGSWPETPLLTEAAADIQWMRRTLMLALGLRETEGPRPEP